MSSRTFSSRRNATFHSYHWKCFCVSCILRIKSAGAQQSRTPAEVTLHTMWKRGKRKHVREPNLCTAVAEWRENYYKELLLSAFKVSLVTLSMGRYRIPIIIEQWIWVHALFWMGGGYCPVGLLELVMADSGSFKCFQKCTNLKVRWWN